MIAVEAGFCAACGEADPPHGRCVVQLELEPPRFCVQCGRRMVVQVRPDGWWARCSRHGVIDSVDAGRR